MCFGLRFISLIMTNGSFGIHIKIHHCSGCFTLPHTVAFYYQHLGSLTLSGTSPSTTAAQTELHTSPHTSPLVSLGREDTKRHFVVRERKWQNSRSDSIDYYVWQGCSRLFKDCFIVFAIIHPLQHTTLHFKIWSQMFQCWVDATQMNIHDKDNRLLFFF